MTECNSSVMREVLLDQYVAIESAHLRNRKDTDGSERSCCNRKNLSMCNVSTKLCICGTLQTEECDISRSDISLSCSVCYFNRKTSCHNLLISHLTERKLAGCGISAMESHESVFQCVWEFIFNLLIVHICRYRVVDIQ